MRAGFMDDCRTNMEAAVDCGCLFSKLTSRSAYSTPQRFAAMANKMQATKKIPAPYMRALDSCLTKTPA